MSYTLPQEPRTAPARLGWTAGRCDAKLKGMISRAHRFHGYNSLRQVYRHGGITRGAIFAVKSMPNPRRQTYRVAVVVSRKIHKSAVSRNRMRRRLYELVRELEPQITQPFDIVITVFQNSLLEASPHQLKSQLKKQFKDAGIINSKNISSSGK